MKSSDELKGLRAKREALKARIKLKAHLKSVANTVECLEKDNCSFEALLDDQCARWLQERFSLHACSIDWKKSDCVICIGEIELDKTILSAQSIIETNNHKDDSFWVLWPGRLVYLSVSVQAVSKHLKVICDEWPNVIIVNPRNSFVMERSHWEIVYTHNGRVS